MNKHKIIDLSLQTELSENVKFSHPFPLNQILFGPSGTGKTYNTINKALAIIEAVTEDALQKEDRIELKKRFDAYLESGQIMFTTFHQNRSYEDFIEGVKPIKPQEGNEVTYKVKKGIFRKICKKAKTKEVVLDEIIPDEVNLTADNFDIVYKKFANDVQKKGTIELKTLSIGKIFNLQITNKGVRTYPHDGTGWNPISKKRIMDWWLDSPEKGVDTYASVIASHIKKKYSLKMDNQVETIKQTKNYVLIIDEINRGDVSKIFGELITLIEDDKRLGEVEALKITLPYSKKSFGVPNNLYIIGTMNTAVRSVETLDIALRRRFSFVEMSPNYNLSKLNTEIYGYSLSNILKTINKRIEKLLDKNHLIGHTYFLSVKTIDDLKETFQNKIIPLLQEYFFDDYGKIGLVLGSGFVAKDDSADEIFTDFAHHEKSQLAKKELYRLENAIDMNPETFKKALDNMKIK
jgi:5-methylcytosine-specific restriction enzyme B